MAAVRVEGSISALLEVFLPAPCLCCEATLPGNHRALCPSCQARLIPLGGTRCPTCCGPTDEHDAPCLSCLDNPGDLTAMVAWGEYDDVLREAILALKHHGRDELLSQLTARLAARVSMEEWFSEIDVVTAVPSHVAHRLRRGYTAADLLATDLGRTLLKPWRPTLRRHGLVRQVGRTRHQRKQLAKSCFSITPGAHITGKNLLLVDDVSTTGSTIRLAARTLRRGGAKKVYGAVMASAPDPRRMV